MAFTSGMDISTGDAIVFLDGDLQDPPELIEKFYRKWREGYQVVYGVREKREAPLVIQIAYRLFYRIFHSVSYVSMPLDAGDFSLIDRRLVDILKSFPERDRFLRGLRAWIGFRQTGIPYTRRERVFGKTTNNLFRNFEWAKRGIFSFSYVPLQVMTMVSLITFVISVLAMIVQILLRILLPDLAPKGTTTILITVLFIGSIQLLCISVLGEYIGRIFEEVKQRPKYIVKSIIKK
jgi:dolichol-phosphate mannosyltransferase